MQHAGVQFVDLSVTDATNAEAMVAEMNEQNFHPIIESSGPIYVNNFTQGSGGAKDADGIWLDQPAALYLGGDAKSVPSVDTFLEWVQKVHPGFVPDLYTLYGWTSAQLLVQAIRAAGTDPTSLTVLDALKKIHSFDADGLISPADPASKAPGGCVVIARIVNGVFIRQSPPSPKTGFICNPPYYNPPG
jgi:hypothetical protein